MGEEESKIRLPYGNLTGPIRAYAEANPTLTLNGLRVFMQDYEPHAFRSMVKIVNRMCKEGELERVGRGSYRSLIYDAETWGD